MTQIRAAVVGLEFGASFLPALAAHPGVAEFSLCDTNPATLARVAAQYGVPDARRYASLDAVLGRCPCDAVLLFTPIPDHAKHVLAAFAAGKHVACAVPMATTLEDLAAVIAARRKANKTYMMMETSLYSPEFLYVQSLHAAGEFGRIQYLRGTWQVSLENHPRYWNGLPPLHYITHPLSPILKLAGGPVTRAVALGTGVMREDYQTVYGNPYPIETALFEIAAPDGRPLAAQVLSMTLEASFTFKETFDLIGSTQSFNWATFGDDPHALIRTVPALQGGMKYPSSAVMRFQAPTLDTGLPAELRKAGPRSPQTHLVHEFVSAVLENRASAIDVVDAARYTAPGLCAHQSAMRRGEPVDVPAFD